MRTVSVVAQAIHYLPVISRPSLMILDAIFHCRVLSHTARLTEAASLTRLSLIPLFFLLRQQLVLSAEMNSHWPNLPPYKGSEGI